MKMGTSTVVALVDYLIPLYFNQSLHSHTLHIFTYSISLSLTNKTKNSNIPTSGFVSGLTSRCTGLGIAALVFQTPIWLQRIAFRALYTTTLNDEHRVSLPFSPSWPPLSYIANINMFHHCSSFSWQIQQDGNGYRLSGSRTGCTRTYFFFGCTHFFIVDSLATANITTLVPSSLCPLPLTLFVPLAISSSQVITLDYVFHKKR
jgi:hypothetical protein